MSSRETLFNALGTIMALALFWAAGHSATGEMFQGVWHYIAHFATFALFGAMWTLGLPRVKALAIAAGIVAFGFVHEAYEILGHVHGFELADAIVDGLGGIVGTLCLRLGCAGRGPSGAT